MINAEEEMLFKLHALAGSAIVLNNAWISSKSVFSDLIWDRREFKASRTQLKGGKIYWMLHFVRYGSTHHSVLISMKEFAYALLFDPIEDDIRRDTKSVHLIVNYLGNFLKFLQEKCHYNISVLNHEDMQEYVVWLMNERLKSELKVIDSQDAALAWATARISALQLYYRYGKRVSQPLNVHPLHGKNVFSYFGLNRKNKNENATPVIPKCIWDPYLCAALDYVEIYSHDIIRAHKIRENIRENLLPTYAYLSTFNGSNFTRNRVNEILQKDLVVAFALNPRSGKPWREKFVSDEDLRRELQMLYGACLVVIGGLSGMREAEIALIEVDGFFVDNAEDGISKRFSIVSRVTKGGCDRRESWEVNEPVYNACIIAKKLTSFARDIINYKELFIQGWNRPASETLSAEVKISKNGRVCGRSAILPFGPSTINRYLNVFANDLSMVCDGQYRLPKSDGKTWRFITRMLRRSLAARIAREPFGMIAGMLHYKHVKITTFQGYAGKDSGWVLDLYDEEIAGNDEFLQQVCEDLQDGTLAGGKGEEMVRQFKGMAGDIKRDALQYFIENNRANLHVGLLNYCIFQKDRALCLMVKDTPVGDFPVLNACYPDRCANSCITKKHLPQWNVQVDDARAMLNHKKVTEPQRLALSIDLEKSLRIVNRLKGTL